MVMPRATTRPPFTYATKTGRAAWLELTRYPSHHTVDPVGMLQCLPGIFPVLYGRGKSRRIDATVAPTWRPFAECHPRVGHHGVGGELALRGRSPARSERDERNREADLLEPQPAKTVRKRRRTTLAGARE